MIKRVEDWRFRSKLLFVTLLPLVVVTFLLVIAFTFGLQKVWKSAVPRQTGLSQLDTLTREYQSEVREYALFGQVETQIEIQKIEEEIPEALEKLAGAGDPDQAKPLVTQLEPVVETMLVEGRLVVELVGNAQSHSAGRLASVVEQQLDEFERQETRLEQHIDRELMAAQEELAAAFSRFGWLVLICAGVGLGWGLGLAYWLAQWFERPLGVLREASERILDGNYRAGEVIQSREELGKLAAGFDRATQAIRELVAEKEENLFTLQENQAQLLRSGKLAAVGELAAGVAHEINNPLSAVLTYSVLLREKAEAAPPETLREFPKLIDRLRIIEEAARRCKDIADKLLTFSRQDGSEMRRVDLAAMVDSSIELMKPVIQRNGIVFERQIEADLPTVRGNLGNLQQVMFNLFNNAVFAMSEGGKLSVTVRRVDEACELAIADDGSGIEESILERVFEPFYTTKPPGQGTGLGLSIVYGIIQAHDGDIQVDTEVGQGSTFRVRLPIVEDIV